MIQESATPIRQWDSNVLEDYLQADRTPIPLKHYVELNYPLLRKFKMVLNLNENMLI